MADQEFLFAKKKFLLKKMIFSEVKLTDFRNFKKKIPKVIKALKNFVIQNKRSNHITYGIGAATKGNTLLNCCKFTDKDVRLIFDNSKHKINKFTPSSGIKIIKEKKTLR